MNPQHCQGLKNASSEAQQLAFIQTMSFVCQGKK
jgi:hypothetical protein